MTTISEYKPSDFFDMLGKFEMQTSEAIPSFELEYYVGNQSIQLFKQIHSKIYKTTIMINSSKEEGDDGITGTVFYVIFENQEISLEEFITNLKTNHNGIELMAPIDLDNVYTIHNHNNHAHAGVGFDDIAL